MTTTIEFNHSPTLNFSAVKFTHAQFVELCETNRELQLELKIVKDVNAYKCSLPALAAINLPNAAGGKSGGGL